MTILSTYFDLLLQGLFGSFLLFVFLWILQLIKKDAGWVDVGWTSGVAILAVLVVCNQNPIQIRSILIGLFISIWAIRLVLYIIKDRLNSNDEDSRYQSLRKYFGRNAAIGFFFFFTLQSFLVVLFVIPLLPSIHSKIAFGQLSDYIGIIVWTIAMIGEWLADYQLTKFRRNPLNKNKVCRNGLWQYSRHPNYFFEWLQWIAFVIFSYGAEGAWLSLVGPFFMYVFLMKITGIPHIERVSIEKRGQAYIEYQKEVPIFFPRIF